MEEEIKIVSAHQILALAKNQRSVIVPAFWGKRTVPAAFILSMQLNYVIRLIDKGMYLYEKKS